MGDKKGYFYQIWGDLSPCLPCPWVKTALEKLSLSVCQIHNWTFYKSENHVARHLRLENIVVADLECERSAVHLEDVVVADNHDWHCSALWFWRVRVPIYDPSRFFDQIVFSNYDGTRLGYDLSLQTTTINVVHHLYINLCLIPLTKSDNIHLHQIPSTKCILSLYTSLEPDNWAYFWLKRA